MNLLAEFWPERPAELKHTMSPPTTVHSARTRLIPAHPSPAGVSAGSATHALKTGTINRAAVSVSFGRSTLARSLGRAGVAVHS